MRRIVTNLLLLAAAALLSACGTNGKPATAAKPRPTVDLLTVAASTLVEGIDVTGSLEPKFWADVRTQIPGLVKEVAVTEWVRVRKGQRLARIDVAETEALVKRAEASVEGARAGLAQSQVAVARAEREQARLQKLKEAGLATQQALDDARTECDAARTRVHASAAQIRAAEEELRQAGARLTKGVVLAPLDGVVAQRNVNVGDLASDAATANPIFRIVDNRLLNLTVTVPSQAAARVTVGQPLEFTVDSLPGKSFKGTVMFINPELNSADRSLRIIAEVSNSAELLKSGLFAKGRIVTGSRTGVVQIPRNVLTAWDTAGRTGTLFVLEGETARIRQVATGTQSGELVEVTSGLRPGERVVARGGFTLRDGEAVTIAGTVRQP